MYLSKLAREMLRLAASGQSPSTQDSKSGGGRTDGARLHLRMTGGAGFAAPFLGRGRGRGGGGGGRRLGRDRHRRRRPADRHRRQQPVALGERRDRPRRPAARQPSASRRSDAECFDISQFADRKSNPHLDASHVAASAPGSPIIGALLGQDMVERALTRNSPACGPVACAEDALPPGPQPLDQLLRRIGVGRQADLELGLFHGRPGGRNRAGRRPRRSASGARSAAAAIPGSAAVVGTTGWPLPGPTGGAPASRVPK